MVRAEGCSEMQGFLFSPAIAAEALRKLLLGEHVLCTKAA